MSLATTVAAVDTLEQLQPAVDGPRSSAAAASTARAASALFAPFCSSLLLKNLTRAGSPSMETKCTCRSALHRNVRRRERAAVSDGCSVARAAGSRHATH